uniref:Uncharacterized protein n=1 Tax=Peronospora matthiolae TaxID=2874970 RepID=A0AAV1UL90_9STRA
MVADGESLQLTRVFSVCLEVPACGAGAVVTLTDVYLGPRLASDMVSYGSLENRDFSSSTTATSARSEQRWCGQVRCRDRQQRAVFRDDDHARQG